MKDTTKSTLKSLLLFKDIFYRCRSRTINDILNLLGELHDEPYYFEVMSPCYNDFQGFTEHQLPEFRAVIGDNVSKLSEDKQKAYETFKNLSEEQHDAIDSIISVFCSLFDNYFSDDSCVGFLIQNNTYMMCEGVGEREIYYGNS